MENGIPERRIDRSAFSVLTLQDAANDVACWQTRTPVERLEALEWMRQILYDYDPATARLEKVLTVVDRA